MRSRFYYDDGKPLVLTQKIGQGGEGAVYAVEDRQDVAAKIYHDADAQREHKVQSMIDAKLRSSNGAVAFPISRIFDKSDNFSGFVMARVDHAQPLHELYSPAARKANFPQANYRFLFRVSQNIARALAEVHDQGCIIGDINHSSVLVAKDARVTLIDADSFQLGLVNPIYRCYVGVPEYTAPELQGLSFRQIDRTLQSDYFGLAVIMFQMLQMGQHPFVGVREEGPVALDEAIRGYQYAHSDLRRPGLNPPPSPFSLGAQSPRVKALFERAFSSRSSGSRPTPNEWVQALKASELALKTCARFPEHKYPERVEDCPWCAFHRRTGSELFPVKVPLDQIRTNDTSLFPVSFEEWVSELDKYLQCGADGISFEYPENFKKTVASARNSLPSYKKYLAWSFMATPIFSLLFAQAYFVLGLVLFFVGLAIHPDNQGSKYDMPAKKAKLALETNNWLKSRGVARVAQSKANLDFLSRYQKQLLGSQPSRIASIAAKNEQEELKKFLEGFFLSKASINGIGPSKMAILLSHGIETARDCEYDNLTRISGVGPVTANNIVAWRRKQEAKFRPRTSKQHQHQKAKIEAEREIRSAFMQLLEAARIEMQSVRPLLSYPLSRVVEMPEEVANALASVVAVSKKRQKFSGTVSLGAICDEYNLEAVTQCFESKKPSEYLVHKFRITKGGKPRNGNLRSNKHSSRTASGLPKACPQCRSPMLLRTAKRPPFTGNKFYGCSRFPICKGTRSV